MKNRIIVLIIIFILGGCSYNDCENEALFADYKKVIQTFQKSEDLSININFTSLTKFDYDSLFIFTPYTTVDEMYEVLGSKWNLAENTQISQSDEFNLIVFKNKMKVESYIKIPRNYGDFIKVKKNKRYNDYDTNFKLMKEEYGGQLRLFFYIE